MFLSNNQSSFLDQNSSAILTRQQVSQPSLLHSHLNDVLSHHCEFHILWRTFPPPPSNEHRKKKEPENTLTLNSASIGLFFSLFHWATAAFYTKYKLFPSHITFTLYNHNFTCEKTKSSQTYSTVVSNRKISAINSVLLPFGFCAVSILICVLVKACKAVTIHLNCGFTV